MKRVLIVCGTGIATSTVIADSVKRLCTDNGIDAQVMQCKVTEVRSIAENYDLIVASTKIPQTIKTPYVNGVSYLSGVNIEKTEQEILEKLRQS
jgi:galactitol PTS system EIIB component